jgi:hypothetical protein
MRLTDIIIAQDLEENVLGGITGALKGLKRGTPVKGYQAGYAQAQGAEKIKQQATALFQDFFNIMGQHGQRPRGKDLIDYLTQKRYPTKQALAILAGDSAVPTRAVPPAAGNVPAENPVAAAEPTTPPAVFKTNPNRGNQAPVAEARGMYALELSPKIAWEAILAATRENLKLGGGLPQGLSKQGGSSSGGSVNFGSAQSSSAGTGNTGSILATGPAQSSNASGSNLTPESILQAYQSFTPANRKKLKDGIAEIDSGVEVKTRRKASTKSTIVNPSVTHEEVYSRFLGQKL